MSIVIGAGINGAGIARDAAMRGLKVLLVDKGDFGGGTSSASTRLIHGGLRYLEHFEFGLVRESLRERETLLRIAPHLVRPLPITIPIYKREQARTVDDSRRHDCLRPALVWQVAAASSDAFTRGNAERFAGTESEGLLGVRTLLRRAS